MERTSCLALPVGRISEVCRMCTKAGFSQEFPLLQQIHMGGAEFLHIIDSFAHSCLEGWRSLYLLSYLSGNVVFSFSIPSRLWGCINGVVCRIYMCLWSLSSTYLLPRTALKIKYEIQGLNSHQRHPWTVLEIDGKFGAWILTIYSHSVVSLLPFKSFYPSHHVSIYFSGYLFSILPIYSVYLSFSLSVPSGFACVPSGMLCRLCARGACANPYPKHFLS